MSATLDAILDAVSRLTSKRRSVAEMSYAELGIACWKTDINAAKVIREMMIADRDASPSKLNVSTKVAGTGDTQLTGDFMESNSHAEFSAAQLKADFCYRAFNDAAPPPMRGETVLEYRARLATKFQQHSKLFKDAKLANLGCPHALGAIENEIYADAVAALNSGGTAAPGQLVPIVKMDSSGRPVTRYVSNGDGACWDNFNQRVRYVTRFIVPRSH